MTSTGYTLYLQQGAGKYEDSKKSEVSGQGTESSREETENLVPWLRIHDKALIGTKSSQHIYLNSYTLQIITYRGF